MYVTWWQVCTLLGGKYVRYLVASMYVTWWQVCTLLGGKYVRYLVASMYVTWWQVCTLLGGKYVHCLVASMYIAWWLVCTLLGGKYVHYFSYPTNNYSVLETTLNNECFSSSFVMFHKLHFFFAHFTSHILKKSALFMQGINITTNSHSLE